MDKPMGDCPKQVFFDCFLAHAKQLFHPLRFMMDVHRASDWALTPPRGCPKSLFIKKTFV
jgi:hypothetical protein